MKSHGRRLEDYYCRQDTFGRIFFDKCATDEEHLLNTKIPPGEDRPRCRVYVEDLLPAGAVGQKGTWIIRTQMWMPDFPDYVPAEEDDGG